MPDMATGIDLQNEPSQQQQQQQLQLQLQHHTNPMLQMYPSEANTMLLDADLEAYPRYRLIKMMKSWVSVARKRNGNRKDINVRNNLIVIFLDTYGGVGRSNTQHVCISKAGIYRCNNKITL